MAAVTIVQGEDRVLIFQITEIDSSGNTTYLDMTSATSVELRAPAASSGYVSFTMAASEIAITSAKLGEFSVSMSDIKTALLRVGSSQNAEVTINFATLPTLNIRIAQLLGAISVTAKLFP
jgi:hypothetical protein